MELWWREKAVRGWVAGWQVEGWTRRKSMMEFERRGFGGGRNNEWRGEKGEKKRDEKNCPLGNR